MQVTLRKILYSLGALLFAAVLQLVPVTAFAMTSPVTVRIPVACTAENSSESFTCVLDMESTELQRVDRLMLRLRDGETSAFSVQYLYPGTYHYKIHQEAGGDIRTSYDSSVYLIDVYVTEDEDGTLFAEPVAYTEGSDEKKAEVRFTNVRQTPSTSKVSSVNTGDPNDLIWLFVLAVASAAGLLLALILYLRQRKGGDRT